MKVLITGGSGYLGQFIVDHLAAQQHEIAYTYHRKPLPASSPVQAFHVDIAKGKGLVEAVATFRPEVVINTAALSQPAACEQDYEACRALNRPTKLVEALLELEEQQHVTALLIHLSTGQVYNGAQAWWSEDDPADPINAYGRSKLEAEQLLQEQWPGKFVSLRSNLIFGPEPPLAPVDRPLFLQFVQQVLGKGQATTFFVDEYRCEVYVQDICSILSHIISRASWADGQSQAATQTSSSGTCCVLAGLPHSVYNMGGPDRLSRHDMAMAVARHCGLETKPILTAQSADVKRCHNSPLDISMKMDRLLQDMPGVVLTPFVSALHYVFPGHSTREGQSDTGADPDQLQQ